MRTSEVVSYMIDLQSERQFLVTDYQASIMNNLVAMALTLSGPRLWILIKRLAVWAYKRLRRGNRVTGWRLDHEMELASSNIDIIQESHSELSASLSITMNIMGRLRPRIEIPHVPQGLNHNRSDSALYQWSARAWTLLLERPINLLMSLSLSVMFVGIFVAGASGSVLSAKITSDRVALANSRLCCPPERNMMGNKAYNQAAPYSRQCYRQPFGAEGCGYLFQQDIAYTERAIKACPWRYNTCDTQNSLSANIDTLQKFNSTSSKSKIRDSAVLFDTGLVDSSIIRINSPRRYQFRRAAVCAPCTFPTRGHQVFRLAIRGWAIPFPLHPNIESTLI